MAFWPGFGLHPVKPGHRAIVSQRRWPGLAWPELARLGPASWPEAGLSTSLVVALLHQALRFALWSATHGIQACRTSPETRALGAGLREAERRQRHLCTSICSNDLERECARGRAPAAVPGRHI